MALTGPWPWRTRIPAAPIQKHSNHLLHCTSQELGCPRVRRTTKGQIPVATHVAAPERPPGYVQRPRRRSNKQTVITEEEVIQQAPEQLQQASREQHAVPAANRVAAVGTVLHSPQEKQQQQLQDWQQQQLLLQQQWQQQALQEEARQQRQHLQRARQQPSTPQQQQQQQQAADFVHDQQDLQVWQQPGCSLTTRAAEQQQHPQHGPIQQQSHPRQQQQELHHPQQSSLRQLPLESMQQQQQHLQHTQQQQQLHQQWQRHTQPWQQQEQHQQPPRERQQQQQPPLPQQKQEPGPQAQVARRHELYNSSDGLLQAQQRSRIPSSSTSSSISSDRPLKQAVLRTRPAERQAAQHQREWSRHQQQRLSHQQLQQYTEHWQSQQQQLTQSVATASSSSSSSVPRPSAPAAAAGGAYSIVPAVTAPTVAAAAARAAARSAARAAAATAAVAAGSSSSSSGVSLPPVEQCVPQHFWGLMREEFRPWHKQVLVHLCYCLPAPACFIYRDMRAGTMQGLLAQRAVLEKGVRQCLLDLMWQQKRLRGWLDTVTRKDAGYVNPDHLHQAQKELLQLKATIGRTKKQLQQLQLKARTYSDSDYCQYSSQFEPLLQQMDELCDTARQEQVGLVLSIQALADDVSRRVLYAPSAAAAAAIQQKAAALIQQKVDQQLVIWKLVKQQVRGLSNRMRGQQGLETQGTARGRGLAAADNDDVIAWRYPPAEFILWRVKGRFGGSRPPLIMPGLNRKMPQARQNVEQL